MQLLSPAGFEFNRLELPVPGLPRELNGLRILHLTDLHLTGRWSRAYDQLLQHTHATPPDLICVTGDFIDSRWNPRPGLKTAERLVGGLKSLGGTFAVLGNHDTDFVAHHVHEWNCTLLDPGHAYVRPRGSSLEILGLPCVARRDLKPRILGKFPGKRRGTPRIVLSHYPDHIRKIRSLEADVVLTGHTHGGQVCLPWGRPLITHDSLPMTMSAGVYRVDRSWLVISRGLGFATYQLRVFCPAEVIEIQLLSPESRG